MVDKDYSHRSAVEKLGVKPDERVEVSEMSAPVCAETSRRHSGVVWSAAEPSTGPS